MNLVLNEEQRLLKETVKDFLHQNGPVQQLRSLRDSDDPLGYKPELWQQMVELGLSSIIMPEEYGGFGFGYLGLGAVLEEMGRNLTASPLFASVVLCAPLLIEGGSEQQKQKYLAEIAAGNLTLALAIDEGHHYDPLQTALSLSDSGGELSLNGSKVFVLDGHSADKLIVVARSSGNIGDSEGLSLVLLDRETQGVTVTRTLMMDGRNAANISFDNVRVKASDIIGQRDKAFDILQPVLDKATICIAAEMLGGARETFERTVEYLKEREQFDIKIGSFQALQHRCANMFCQIEQCKSAVIDALSAIDSEAEDLSVRASLAKTLTGDCYQHITNEAIQMHGGMGITDELDIGLFLKRARVSLQILGDSAFHKQRYATLRGY